MLLKTHCFLVAVPPHWCYVLPRSTEAGGAIIDRHGPSGLGHITWEDLSPSTAVYSMVPESWRIIFLLLIYNLKNSTIIYFCLFIKLPKKKRELELVRFKLCHLTQILIYRLCFGLFSSINQGIRSFYASMQLSFDIHINLVLGLVSLCLR